MIKVVITGLAILFCSGCVMMNTQKRLDLTPDGMETRYKTDQDFNGTGYEFTVKWGWK